MFARGGALLMEQMSHNVGIENQDLFPARGVQLQYVLLGRPCALVFSPIGFGNEFQYLC